MSIFQEYEQIRREMGEKKYDSIEKYLETHSDVLLSDILYKPEHYINFDKWYNWKILNRKVRVNSIYETSFDDVRCDAVLYQNDKAVANIIASYEANEMNFKCNNDPNLAKEVLRVSILDDFDKYIDLPKVSKCSKLLQDIYDDVCQSDASMCHITEEDWNEFYKEDFTEKDVDNLKREVKELGLQEVITFDDAEYKIVGWGDLETRFNDDRYLQEKVKDERGDR
ncbi:MAG: hypothetical protein J5892_01585 [Bacilli bacterium]|nr:hypothetical protein [Bacilli bacterium]